MKQQHQSPTTWIWPKASYSPTHQLSQWIRLCPCAPPVPVWLHLPHAAKKIQEQTKPCRLYSETYRNMSEPISLAQLHNWCTNASVLWPSGARTAPKDVLICISWSKQEETPGLSWCPANNMFWIVLGCSGASRIRHRTTWHPENESNNGPGSVGLQ